MLQFDKSGFSYGGSNIATLSDGALGNGSRFTMDAAAIGTGLAFLNGELEKRDPRLLEPLTSTTWPRDIVAETGGGFVDYTSVMSVDYATSGGNEGALVGGSSDTIALMQANLSKDVYPVVTWAQGMKLPYVDQEKLRSIPRSMDAILDRGIRLNYEKSLDQLVYAGFDTLSMPGMINNPDVVTALATTGASGSTAFQTKGVDEILWDVNKAVTEGWEGSEYDPSALANHILLSPDVYAYLASTRIGTSGDKSILTYLLENNMAVNQGGQLSIHPCRWLKGAGTGGTNRMMVYVNRKDMIYFDLPVPLQRAMTQPVATLFAYVTVYVAQMGQVKFLYTQPARYVDGV